MTYMVNSRMWVLTGFLVFKLTLYPPILRVTSKERGRFWWLPVQNRQKLCIASDSAALNPNFKLTSAYFALKGGYYLVGTLNWIPRHPIYTQPPSLLWWVLTGWY